MHGLSLVRHSKLFSEYKQDYFLPTVCNPFFPLFLVLNIYLMLPHWNSPTSLQFEQNQTGEAAKEQEAHATDNGLCVRQRTDPYTVI